jgi:hypothetical protein
LLPSRENTQYVILAYHSNNIWACKHLIYSYSTIYMLGGKIEGLGGCPPRNASAKEKSRD